MNDFDYENLQKKRIANNAARMKRGSKSKKCTLLSDYLTPAQIKKRNGAVKVMNMSNPVLWADFKDWPVDLQKEYLDRRMCDFDCTMSGLAEIFDVDVVKLRKTLVSIGFDMGRFVVGRKMTKENRARMLAWIAEHRGGADSGMKVAKAKKATKAPTTVIEPSVRCEATAEEVTEPEHDAVENNVYSCMDEKNDEAKFDSLMKTPFVKMDFIGKLNPSQIVNTLLALAKDRDVRVSVTLEYQEG